MTLIEQNSVSDSVMKLTQLTNFFYFLTTVSLISVSPSAAADNFSLDEGTRCYGRVEIYHNNSWGTICNDRWDLSESEVLCKQLNCGTALETYKQARRSQHVWPFIYTCTGNERSLEKCSQTESWNQQCHREAGVFCSGALQQPSLSLTSPDGGLTRLPGGAEITKGYRFVFTCSITSSYAPGSFILKLPGSDLKNSGETFNHSASFDFSVAGYEHQGKYSCVYQVKLENTHMSKEAEPIHVTIRYSLLIPLIYSVSAGIVLLLLIVLLVVFLVRKKRRVKHQEALNQIYVRHQYEEDADEEEEDDEGDYVNVTPQDTNREIEPAGEVEEEDEGDHDYALMENEKKHIKVMKGSAAVELSDNDENVSDDHDYELVENEDDHIKSVEGYVTAENKEEVVTEEEEDSCDENDYVNLADSDQFVDIYGSQIDIYQNI